MKMKSVRSYLKKKAVGVFETRTSDSVIIIDGNYLKSTYKSSDCQFILGGEYDRYASYLRKVLTSFTNNGVECYVIFGGGMKADLEKRKEIHQNIINKTDAVQPDCVEIEYCEPTFVKDVQREIFEELSIRYFICEYDHKEALLSLAMAYNFPVLTNNFEYCLFGVTCIIPNSLVFDVDKGFRCTVYHSDKKLFPLSNDIMSILLAISDEDSSYYKHMPKILRCHENTIFVSAQHWIRRQSKTSAIEALTKYLKPFDRKSLLDAIGDIQKLFRCRTHPVSESFRSRHAVKTKIIDTDNSDWFERGVSNGLIAIPYINLKNNKTFSGSWLIVDKNKNDAMLVTLDLVFYALGLLMNTRNQTITFIGRKFTSSVIWEIEKTLPSSRALELFRSQHEECPSSTDLFRLIIQELLHGFDFTLLDSLPEDCHMIIIALVYYSVKKREDFKRGVCSVILSYFMLGLVSKEVGVLKRSNFTVTHNANDNTTSLKKKHNLYVSSANAFMDFFYINKSHLKNIFYRDVLHRIAEFEHCLQHVNFLNRLCGEKAKCTVYHKAINTTFIYNILIILKSEDYPLEYLKKRFNCHRSYSEYEQFINVFDKCLKSVK